MQISGVFVVVVLASCHAHPHEILTQPHEVMTYPDTDARTFLRLKTGNPPRRFTNKVLAKASACRDPTGFLGYCVASAACRAFNGTSGARCPKRPAGFGTCCLVDRCPVAPPLTPAGGAVVTSPIPGSGSAIGAEVQYICLPGLVFDGIADTMVTATCDARGAWSPDVIPDCVTPPPTGCEDAPPAAPTGVLVEDGGDRSVGALVYYLCETGTFATTNGSAIMAARCSEDGLWSPAEIPLCVLPPPTGCADLPPVAPLGVVQHYDGNTEIGAVAVYTCGTAGEFFPTGSTFDVVSCAEDGTWQPAVVPTCAIPPP